MNTPAAYPPSLTSSTPTVRSAAAWAAINRAQSSGGCQRTLEVSQLSDATQPLRVLVRGYDDNGRAVPVAGATVSAAAQTAVTGADGTASFPAFGTPTTRTVDAQRAGMVPSFPVRVASA